ncbi:MAG: aminotransferase class I/II-fold pyridoxal phosphate-dependent enzyme [Hasllibacter sp.]
MSPDGAPARGAFRPFAVERFLSENEHGVRLNFSESGVHPMTAAELAEVADVDMPALLARRLDYPQVNGTELLRQRIAALYPGAGPGNVLVTVGATEANTLAAQVLLSPGDAVVGFRPTYEQFTGNAWNLGAAVRQVDLRPAAGWAVDRDALAAAAPGARAIHVVNPNNPTGAILSDGDRAAIVAAAETSGAWIVADEVYAGTERASGAATPTFWGTASRVVCVGSLSKAYGLPGLRLGWLVAPEPVIAAAWRRHEYAAISAASLSMHLAEAALAPAARSAITARARRLIRRGYDTLAAGLARHGDVFHVVPPAASAMSFVGYDLPVDSATFARRLLDGHGVLVIPGACFGVEGRFRFSSALPEDRLAEGLDRIGALIASL